MNRTERLRFLGWWLLVGLTAAAVCSLYWPAAHFVDEYLPVGNDSFYHARRILDTVANPSAFYEFDKNIHAPEGSLLVWPWGYDYAMAWLARAGLALGIASSPMAILVWIPVVAVFATIGLTMLIARRLGLSEGLVVVAALAAALSPLTQGLHGVGQLDHHFAEHIFVLASIACGLRWLSRPDDARAAIVVGAVLGAAPAIHNGMFILQLPVLATLLLLWLQDVRLPRRTTRLFAAALFLTTLAILIPSLPFRLGLFEYYRLSWFHLYVASATAGVSLALAFFRTSKHSIALLTIAALVLLLPLTHQIMLAGGFLGGTIVRLDAIVEMHSLPPMVMTPPGRLSLSQTYTMLVWLIPVTAIYCVWRGWQERATARLFFWMWCLLGLTLLLTQLRLHYFGSFALYLPWLVVAQACLVRWQQQTKVILLSVGLVFLLAYWMSGRYSLASVGAPAGDGSFRALRPILGDLRKACAEDPGIVLADNDAGQYIRYYTDCPVIANNFLLTRQHEQKIELMDYLTSLPATVLPDTPPFVRYVLVRPVTIFAGEKKSGQEQVKYMSYSPIAAQLVSDLLLKPLDEIPPNYVLIEQANIHDSSKNESIPYIRLYKVNRSREPNTRDSANRGAMPSSLKPVSD